VARSGAYVKNHQNLLDTTSIQAILKMGFFLIAYGVENLIEHGLVVMHEVSCHPQGDLHVSFSNSRIYSPAFFNDRRKS
jgi:hypothetical protein